MLIPIRGTRSGIEDTIKDKTHCIHEIVLDTSLEIGWQGFFLTLATGDFASRPHDASLKCFDERQISIRALGRGQMPVLELVQCLGVCKRAPFNDTLSLGKEEKRHLPLAQVAAMTSSVFHLRLSTMPFKLAAASVPTSRPISSLAKSVVSSKSFSA